MKTLLALFSHKYKYFLPKLIRNSLKKSLHKDIDFTIINSITLDLSKIKKEMLISLYEISIIFISNIKS